MTELELSVLARQALTGRMSTLDEVSQQVVAWQDRRNREQRAICWHFTTQDARVKLHHHYRSFED